MRNIILSTDSYKLCHWNMYPSDTEQVYSYFESRKGAKFPYTVFFGLQYILQEYLEGIVVTQEEIEEAEKLVKAHLGSASYFNRKGWQTIVDVYGGRLPLCIKAVPEGTCVPENNVMMTVHNTDTRVPWLTNAVESLLTHVWYPCTVATLSHFTRETIRKYFERSATDFSGLNFMLHDFGYRGVSSEESARIGGAAHLLSFLGTDTVPAISLIQKYYSIYDNFNNLAFSVPATEHSIMTSLGIDGELEIINNLLDKYPTGILSVVADSRDIYAFVQDLVCVQLKERILKRDGVFVIRPDSVTPMHKDPAEQVVWILNCLSDHFGFTMNDKGFKVIPKVKVLWGDGIDFDGVKHILDFVIQNGYSVENIATFGMGGGLLQKVNRDTQRFAFKASSITRGGNEYDIYKETLDNSKASKRGRLKLIMTAQGLQTVSANYPDGEDVMRTVFCNGRVLEHEPIFTIRERLNNQTL